MLVDVEAEEHVEVGEAAVVVVDAEEEEGDVAEEGDVVVGAAELSFFLSRELMRNVKRCPMYLYDP